MECLHGRAPGKDAVLITAMQQCIRMHACTPTVRANRNHGTNLARRTS